MCGKCEYRRYIDGEWVCDNEESENYGLEVSYSDDNNEYQFPEMELLKNIPKSLSCIHSECCFIVRKVYNVQSIHDTT